jgi:hypothetical protein
VRGQIPVHLPSFLSLKVCAKITRTDSRKIIPMIESALVGVNGPNIKALFDMTELENWELRAA